MWCFWSNILFCPQAQMHLGPSSPSPIAAGLKNFAVASSGPQAPLWMTSQITSSSTTWAEIKIPDHLHCLTHQPEPNRWKKRSIFRNRSYTTDIETGTIEENLKTIHSKIVTDHTRTIEPNKILNEPAPAIHPSEQELPRLMRRALAQLRTNKSPLLLQYLNKIDPVLSPVQVK